MTEDIAIPYGYCRCGCGQKTSIAKRNVYRLGHIKGEPLQYVRGHTTRTRSCRNTPPNPSGLCMCGCGQKTNISLSNNYGNVAGTPMQFLHGHMFNNHETHPGWKGGRKIACSGRYTVIMMPEHPRSCDGYVLEHIVMVEKVLGKPLPDNACVHHVNGDGTDNINSNFVVCEDNAYHMLLHARQRAYKACGNANYRKCWVCKKWDEPAKLNIDKHTVHPGCFLKYKQKRKAILDDRACG